jgi:hypothetical protein
MIMRDLGRHRGKHHCSLLSLTPITFDANTLSCCGGSYFATIAVRFVIRFRIPLNLGRATNAHIIIVVYSATITADSENVPLQNCLPPLSLPPLRALQLSTPTLQPSFSSELHHTSMGHACLVCTHLYIGSYTTLMEGRVLPVPFFLQRIIL